MPLLHNIFEFYKIIYLLSSKISKRDRFGIFTKIEMACLEMIESAIIASFEQKFFKLPPIKACRIKVEVLKRFIRLTFETKIIDEKRYIVLQTHLQEISKMLNGWIKYCDNTQKEA